ncbi:hypothetical protein ABPG72_004813 [Tetrahymena utriculariae]
MNNDNYESVPINVVKCNNPSLDGFYCLDYSNFSNYTLQRDDSINNLAQVQIFAYGCQDKDSQKMTIPDNYAHQQDIDNLLNYFSSSLKIQIKTSNTTLRLRNLNSLIHFLRFIHFQISTQQIL